MSDATPTPTLAQRITPGPWRVAQYSTGAEIGWWPTDYKGDEYGKPLIIASVISNRHDDPMGNANAELIALAPTLLAQLDTERALVEEASRTIAELHKQVSELRAALEAIDKLSCNCPCMSLQAQRDFERCTEANDYKVELCRVVLAMREQARAALA